MQQNRRQLLRTAGLAAAALGLAGCNSDSETGTTTGTGTGTTTGTPGSEASAEASASVSAEAAVATEWNVMRSRLDDAYTLGLAGQTSAGASVAQSIFQRFEGASGEYGAHEMLEATSEESYENFESALEALIDDLEAGDVEAAEDGWADAQTSLRVAQLATVGDRATYALDLLRFGAATNNVEVLAAAGHTEAAQTVAEEVTEWFEDAAVHSVLEETDGEAYERFEGAIESAGSAAVSGNVESVRTATDDALAAAATGAYSITAEEIAGAGHIAAMSAQGFDAAVLSSLGGPSTGYAHATILTTYRARIHDAGWLADRGESDRARTIAQDVFAHFEADRTGHHEALEEANHEAYEGFESGLDSLTSAIDSGDSGAIDDAVATVDDTLVAGIESLAGSTGGALLEAAYFRARVGDAVELYNQGHNAEAASIGQSLFATFEGNELGFHEAFEDADHEGYEAFEGALESLIAAFENDTDTAVATQSTATLEALLGFETTVGSTAQVSAAESAYMTARAFDAAAVALLGSGDRGSTIAQESFEFFETGAGGFHEALEDASEETYESFEETLGAVRETAQNGGDVYGAAKTYSEDTIDAAYAIVTSAGGAMGGAAATVMGDVYGAFETAEVHELLEAADHEAYERFEAELEGFQTTLTGEGSGSVTAFADASLRAQFAVVGAVDAAPVGESSSGGEAESDTSLSGGPNVVEGVPEDADHVVDMEAVAFTPEQLTVQVGDTVAFEHVGGEAHTVFADEDNIPSGADYWASGGFDSQSAAESGWENGEGAVQSGQSYSHTFETAGTHEYYCEPHAAAGMEGTIVVEE